MELLITLIIAVIILYLLVSLVINTGHIAESLEEITGILQAEEEMAVSKPAAAAPGLYNGKCDGCGAGVSVHDKTCPSCGLKIN